VPKVRSALLPIAKIQQTLGVTALLGPLVTNRKKTLELGYTEEETDHILLFAGFSVNDTLLEQMARGDEFVASDQSSCLSTRSSLLQGHLKTDV